MTKTMNQKVKAAYNIAAKTYSGEFRNQFKNNRHLDMMIEHLEKGAKILDLGCGSGKPIDSYLTKQGFTVTGLDISEAQIALAKQNVPKAEFMVMDMSELKAGQFQVDAVVSFYALFHIPREEHFHTLQMIRSFLPKQGLVLITMGASEWEGSESDFCGAEMFWSHFGAPENIKLVTQAGFEIIFKEIDTAGDKSHLVLLAQAR